MSIRSKFFTITQAWLCDALEEQQSELTVGNDGVTVKIQPFQTITVRLKTAPRLAGGVTR